MNSHRMPGLKLLKWQGKKPINPDEISGIYALHFVTLYVLIFIPFCGTKSILSWARSSFPPSHLHIAFHGVADWYALV